MRPLKVPVSKNMLDSHLKGKLFRKVRRMVTLIIVDGQVYPLFLWTQLLNSFHISCIQRVSEFQLVTQLCFCICYIVKWLPLSWLLIYLQLQFPQGRGLTSPQYTIAIRLSPDPSLPSESLSHQQSARTCGSSSEQLSSELELVKWNEIFFFKVDDPVCRMFFS